MTSVHDDRLDRREVSEKSRDAEPAREGEEQRSGDPGEADTELAAVEAEPAADGRRQGLTPREARRVRAVTAAVFMACIAVALVVRLGSQPSLVTVAFYGIGLVLSGVAIKLSYRGRTRLAMAVLATGICLAVLEQLLRLF